MMKLEFKQLDCGWWTRAHGLKLGWFFFYRDEQDKVLLTGGPYESQERAKLEAERSSKQVISCVKNNSDRNQ